MQSHLKDVATKGTHISSEGPGKPPEHKKEDDTEEPPLAEVTLLHFLII